jgi:ABC-type branched-subunit amino acid transport system substrate-binding protein
MRFAPLSKLRLAGLAMLSLAMLGAACLAGSIAAQAQSPLKVGISVGTGPVAALGEGAMWGANYVFDKYNAAHPDRKIEIVPVNIGAFEPATGLNSIRKAVLVDHVIALNLTGSPVILAARQFLEEHKVVTFSNGGSQAILKPDNWVQQTSPFWSDEVAVSADYICGKYPNKTMAVLALNGAAGDTAVQSIQQAFPKCGIKIVSVQRYSVPISSLKPQLSAVKLENPDIIFLAAGGPQENTSIVAQARQLGLTSILVGFMGSPEGALYQSASGEGFLYTSFAQKDLPADIKAKTASLGVPVLFGYHFATIFVEAIEGMEKAKMAITHENLRQYLLATQKFDTPSGPFCFESDGHTRISLTMWEVRKGTPVQIKDVPVSSCGKPS